MHVDVHDDVKPLPPLPQTAPLPQAVVTTDAEPSAAVDDARPRAESFQTMAIPASLLAGVLEMGYEAPTPCQQLAIPALMDGRDVLLQAPAGTGKTGAFAIGGLGRMIAQPRPGSVTMVISPNKDLAVQTAKALQAMLRTTNVRVHTSYGGKPRDSQELKQKVRSRSCIVVSATPGRAVQHLGERGPLDPRMVTLLVVDEFDKMLDRFHDEVQDITRLLPLDCQICMTSATANPDVVGVARKILRDPVEFSGTNSVTPSVCQYMIDCGHAEQKVATLLDLLPRAATMGRVIVFANSIPSVERLTVELTAGLAKTHVRVGMVHGEMDLAARDQVVKAYRDGELNVLVATDAIARGFDVQQVSTVFHFGVARDHAGYVHRSSRAGRQGRRGLAVSLVAGHEIDWLRQFEDLEGKEIKPMPGTAFDL
jgi:ATP-dependent RNA helicase DeaD